MTMLRFWPAQIEQWPLARLKPYAPAQIALQVVRVRQRTGVPSPMYGVARDEVEGIVIYGRPPIAKGFLI